MGGGSIFSTPIGSLFSTSYTLRGGDPRAERGEGGGTAESQGGGPAASPRSPALPHSYPRGGAEGGGMTGPHPAKWVSLHAPTLSVGENG